jgi:hypothetical protein
MLRAEIVDVTCECLQEAVKIGIGSPRGWGLRRPIGAGDLGLSLAVCCLGLRVGCAG